jgi:serine/threonine protein kinase
MEKVSKNKSKYIREISLMKDMNKNMQTGFPRLIYHSSDKNYYYIVMDLLYACLKDLKDQQEERQFSIKTVVMIGIQMLQRLESIHKFGYVHRDLKPANMMVGRSTKNDLNIIYLIDFGLTKKQTQAS